MKSVSSNLIAFAIFLGRALERGAEFGLETRDRVPGRRQGQVVGLGRVHVHVSGPRAEDGRAVSAQRPDLPGAVRLCGTRGAEDKGSQKYVGILDFAAAARVRRGQPRDGDAVIKDKECLCLCEHKGVPLVMHMARSVGGEGFVAFNDDGYSDMRRM